MRTKNKTIKKVLVEDLKKLRKHLEYSYEKVAKISFDKEWREEELEVLESFSSRFSRFSDLIVSQYFRSLALEQDPGYRGAVIDQINLAEKNGWIDSAETWKRIRELRNIAAHEYEAEDYKKIYRELISLTPVLLKISLI